MMQISIQHDPLKRIFDLCFSLSVLLFCLPLFLLVALGIKATSPGPVLYWHDRLGRGGRTIRCAKFRTMYVDGDQRLRELLVRFPKARAEWDKYRKLKDDPRVTPLGKFLRKTSLDELPQFWNVLTGEMSVVGPRPIVNEEYERHYKRFAHQIFSVRPGLTGYWQVSGRNRIGSADKARMEAEYAQKRSFVKDLAIIAKTIPALISSRGAY